MSDNTGNSSSERISPGVRPTIEQMKEQEITRGLKTLENMVRKIYGANQSGYLIQKINQKYGGHYPKFGVINQMIEILSEHEKSAENFNNVNRQVSHIKQSRTDQEFSPSAGKRPGHIDNLGRVLSDYNDPILNERGKSHRDIIEQIKSRKEPLSYSRPVEGRYVSYLHQAQKELVEENKLHTARLLSILNNDRDLDEKEKKSYKTRIPRLESFSKDVGLQTAKLAQNSLDYLGRGMWSKSDPAHDKYFDQYNRNRNEAIQSLISKYGAMTDGKARMMGEISNLLNLQQNKGDFLIDKITFQNIMNLIDEHMKEAGQNIKIMHNDKEKDLTELINELNDVVYEEAKDRSKTQDQKLKWRIIQIALIVTPFAGISLLGPIIGAAGNIFAGGFGEGLANIMTSDSFGFLGDIVDALEIDTAVEWLLSDSPILGDGIFNVVDSIITSTPIAEGFFSVVAPVLASPLTPLAIAGMMELKMYTDNHDEAKKSEGNLKRHNKKLESLINEALSQDRINNKDFDEFVNKKFELLSDSYQNEYVVNIINIALEQSQGNEDNFREIIGDELYAYLQQDLLFVSGEIDNEKLLESLFNLKDVNNSVYDRMLNKVFSYRALDQKINNNEKGNLSNLNDLYNNLTSEQRQYSAKEAKELLDQDFIFQVAKSANMTFDETVVDKKCEERSEVSENLKQQLIQKEIKSLSEAVPDKGNAKIDPNNVKSDVLTGFEKPSGSVSPTFGNNLSSAANQEVYV